MATYDDEPVDRYYYSTYNPYVGRYRPREAPWKYKSSYLSHYGDASEAFNNQQRAQLKSILSQINPKLTPRLRKANTKDVAVQVNPKQDASAQCSLGPRTLVAMKRDFRRKKTSESSAASGQSGSPKGIVRYPRTLALYSPVAYRNITCFVAEDQQSPPGETPPAKGREEVEDEAAAVDATVDEDDDDAQKEGEESRDKPDESKKPKNDTAAAIEKASKGQARVRFQFLEQKYGYYHCRECNLRWESAYVWCVQGTNKVYFKQYCRKCQKEFNPYRVEDITCHTCNKARCCCALPQRHVDPKRPHRQDLCGRCKGKRLSCDSTFSFKYII
ncbi:zygote arrest protein 1 [Corythoichthys intestinalis]|uniref:zygote arrest protein 1 n=1 Tax=Corythoichthys intestinalis TaxID=161448 RepID=UPI0025A62166|nr:zygote arrest protein 1 [Corythoichthys intestinalis]XP_061790794.1 zygote arrest protein 1-like [Nerophis lumbriciformis]